jgi:uncharacterized protein (DUF952 family)
MLRSLPLRSAKSTVSDVNAFSRLHRRFTGCVVSHPLPFGCQGKMTFMTRPTSVLLHLCPSDDWSAAQAEGELRPESLTGVGFIHLSTPQQVHLPANRLYSGRDDLVLLHIDPTHLDSPIRWELGVATDPESMVFPHLYGPLPVAAVISVTSYPPDADGMFPTLGE